MSPRNSDNYDDYKGTRDGAYRPATPGSATPSSDYDSADFKRATPRSASTRSSASYGASYGADDHFGSHASPEYVTRVKKKRTKHRALRRALTIIATIVVLVAVGAGVAYGVVKSGERSLKNPDQTLLSEVASATGTINDRLLEVDAMTVDEGKTVSYNGHTYRLNENVVSIAIIGYDSTATRIAQGYAGQADALAVAAIDLSTGKATIIGIPRDSMVDVSQFAGDAFAGMSEMQICLAYSYGDGGYTSCVYTIAAISRVMYDMPMAFYFALNMQGVGPINDAMGGVYLNPLQSIPGTYIVEGEPTVLYGDNALKYVQWRDTSVDFSSLDRQARQVQYIKAFASQTLAAAQGNAGMLVDLFNVAREYSMTNLGAGEMGYLASIFAQNGISDIDVMSLPGEAVSNGTYNEFYLDKTAVYETILNVYYTPVD